MAKIDIILPMLGNRANSLSKMRFEIKDELERVAIADDEVKAVTETNVIEFVAMLN